MCAEKNSVKISEFQMRIEPKTVMTQIRCSLTTVRKKLENMAPNNTLRHLLSGVSMPSNQNTTSTIICIIHGILHSIDSHSSLGTKIEECVDERGLVLLCTQICPRFGEYHLSNQKMHLEFVWSQFIKCVVIILEAAQCFPRSHR